LLIFAVFRCSGDFAVRRALCTTCCCWFRCSGDLADSSRPLCDLLLLCFAPLAIWRFFLSSWLVFLSVLLLMIH